MASPDIALGGALRDPTEPVPDDLGLVGSIIDGRYLIERVVGAGGFGVVFRAHHVQFDSPAAIKVLVRGAKIGRDPAPGGRSPSEGQLQFKLAPLHAAFVHVFEAGVVRCSRQRTLPYLAMEWLDGVTLKALFDSLRDEGCHLSLGTVLHLFDGLARGLGVAHARRIAHRDLKPSNVFLAVTDGTVSPKLLDFGLAKQGSPRTDAVDDTGLEPCPFTPAYGAPEQWDRALGATGPWTDAYAFALMVSELLAGRRWNAELSSSELMSATLDPTRRPTPGWLGAAVPHRVEAVFAQALAVDPRHRYPDVERFWRALGDAAGWKHPGAPVLATELGIVASDRAGSVLPGASGPLLASLPRSRTTLWLGPALGATAEPPASERRMPVRDDASRATMVRSAPPPARASRRYLGLVLVPLGLAVALAAALAATVAGTRSGGSAGSAERSTPAVTPLAAGATGVSGAGSVPSPSAHPAPHAAGRDGTPTTSPPTVLPEPSGPARIEPTSVVARRSPDGGREPWQARAADAVSAGRLDSTSSPRPTASATPSIRPGHPAAVLLEPPMLSRH